jgi:DNA-binding NtrC family response regulator
VADGKRTRVLVVDDEPLIRWSLLAELEERGYDPCEAGDAAQARAELAHGVDVVILDFRLPDANSFELLDEICERMPRVRTVMLTGYASVEHAVEAMRRGAFHYIAKPFELEHVAHVVAAAATAHGADGRGNGDGAGEPAGIVLPHSGVKLDDVEQSLLRQALERTAGNRSRAARLLGITRNQIRYRIRKFGLDPQQRDGDYVAPPRSGTAT